MTDNEIRRARIIGGAIRQARHGKMTAQELADQMTEDGYKMNRDGVLRIETGKARLGFVHALHIFKLLDMKASSFAE